jgi:hypothetical protein
MITPNSIVIITDAYGHDHEAEAVTGVVRGHKIPVVWVRVQRNTGNGTGDIPWPASAVRAKA